MSDPPRHDIEAELYAIRHGLSRTTVPQPGDDDEMRARRKALEKAEINARLSELWWTPPRMIAFVALIGSIIVALGMAFGVLIAHLGK